MGKRAYSGNRLTVTFDADVCIHAAKCVSELPAVFDLKARPWVQPANAAAADVVAQVGRCPSSALQVRADEE